MTAPIVITIAAKTQPKAGAKTFKITDFSGVDWYMWLDQWPNVQESDSIRVESYKTKPFNGAEYHYIDKYSMAAAGNPAPTPPAPRLPIPPRQPSPPQPQPRAAAPYVPPPPQNKDKHIYVCGVVNNLLSNPNFVPESLTKQWLAEMTQLAMSAYDDSLGRKMITTGADLEGEMSDRIPF